MRLSTSVLCLPLMACAGGSPPGQRVALGVAPLSLPGVDYACYDVAIDGPSGRVITLGDPTRTRAEGDDDALCSWQYGNGKGGDIAYVATCDADDGDGDGLADNTVTLWLDGLYADPDGDHDATEDADVGGWHDPCEGGCALTTECRENEDAAVAFNLTVVRDAKQGFFDIGVDFDDIFCSAKLDCRDGLLHDPTSGERGMTAVIAFACTAGPIRGDDDPGTTLYMNDVRVECTGAQPGPGDRTTGEAATRTYYVRPNLGAGQHGPVPSDAPVFFQTAIYTGHEQLPGVDKCYWNNAIGLDPSALGPSCTLHLRATAANGTLADNETPADATRYPVIVWDVPLTDGSGALVCDDAAHPLDGGNGVKTDYAGPGERFTYSLSCDDVGDPGDGGRTSCVVPDWSGGAFTLTQTADGVAVQVGDRPMTAPFDLDDGLTIDTCCGNGCCQ